MKKNNRYDFTLVTEVKNREFETNCLLKYELERRGYSVKIVQTWEEAFHRSKPVDTEVVVSWSMYNDRTFDNIASYVRNCNKMINMQCEQLLTNGALADTNEHKFTGVHGKAKEVSHLAWGESVYNRLINQYGVNVDKVCLSGDISSDFFRKEFEKYYMDRDTLCEQYGIPKEKKVYLFISSFTMVDFPDEMFNDLAMSEVEREYAKLSINSQRTVLEWFESVMTIYPDCYVVYRPHPAERDNKELARLEQEYSNFRVIGEGTIRQWIKAVDKIYSWISTSIKEIFYADKACSILRPYSIKFQNEMEVLNDATKISSKDEFIQTYRDENGFPLPKEIMEKFVYVDKEIPVYVKICDFFEKVCKEEKYNITLNKSSSVKREMMRLYYNIIVGIEKFLFLTKVGRKIISLVGNQWIRQKQEVFLYSKEMKDKNYFTDGECNQVVNKIKRTLENSKEQDRYGEIGN